MSYCALVKKSVANSAAAAGEIYTALVTNMGWTDHDDQSAAGTPYYIFKSTGESSDRFQGYLYVGWDNSADKIEFRLYLHWDNSAHSGTVGMYQITNTSLTSDDDSAFTLWIYGDKDGVGFLSKVGSTYYGVGVDYLDSFYTAFGTLTSGATAGNSKVLQLGAGEADDFVAGQSYQVVGSGSGQGRERPEVTSVDTVSHTVTVDNLARALDSGSVIARLGYLWILKRLNGASNYVLSENTEGTANYSTLATAIAVFSKAYLDPNRATGNYDMWFDLLGASSAAYYGMTTQIPHFPGGSGYEDTIGVDEQVDSTSSGSNTSTTLNDTGESWSTDEWDGYCVIITNGTSAGEMFEIASNTATELTIVGPWIVTPDATSDYVIAKKGYRYFYFNGQYYAFKEVDGGV